jgi:nucleoside-diphosphate-sugar epimerase
LRCLITGGGGFLGRNIALRLLESGHQVRSLSRSHHVELEALKIEQHQGDIADPDAVEKAVDGCDAVFHTAALAGAWGPWRNYFKTNVLGTRHIIDACREQGAKYLIHTSTPSVVFDGQDMENADESAPYARHFEAHYPRSKAVAEKAVLEANGPELRTVALRPHLIWGPGDTNLLPRILARYDAGKLRHIGKQQYSIAPTYIDDAAQSQVLALEALIQAPSSDSAPCGRPYFITSGETISVQSMIDRLLVACGRQALKRRVPLRVALIAGGALEAGYLLTRRSQEPPLTRWVVRELASSHWFDLGNAERDLGYRPAVPIDRGMALLTQSHQSHQSDQGRQSEPTTGPTDARV